MLEIPYIYVSFASGFCLGTMAILGLAWLAARDAKKKDNKRKEKE